MKVGMLLWTFWPEPEGGAERQCRLLVKELHNRGHTCTVFTSRAAKAKSAGDDDSSVAHRFGFFCPLEKRVRRALLQTDRASRLSAVRFWLGVPFVWLSRLSFILSLRVYIVRNPFSPVDVLHVHEAGWLGGVGVWLGRRWNIPVLIKEATRPPLAPISYGTPGRRRWDRYRRLASAYIAQTNSTKNEMVQAGIPSARIHVVPNGVACPTGPELDGTDTVLYVGNLTQGSGWKAFDVLFDAWMRVVERRPDARMIFAGEGDAGPWMEWLNARGIGHTVSFLGRVNDMGACYARAGLFVLPSRIEGMSNALLEAQSWGLPCVVSDIPGNVAIVRHDVNGLIVPVNKADDLAEGILTLLGDAALRARLGREARRLMSINYDIRQIVDRLIGIYESTRTAGSVPG